jgi:hypothetical protein
MCENFKNIETPPFSRITTAKIAKMAPTTDTRALPTRPNPNPNVSLFLLGQQHKSSDDHEKQDDGALQFLFFSQTLLRLDWIRYELS